MEKQMEKQNQTMGDSLIIFLHNDFSRISVIIIHSGLLNRVFGYIIPERLDDCQSSNCTKVLLTNSISVQI